MNSAKILVYVMTGMLFALLGVLVVGLSLGWHKDETSAVLSEATPRERMFDVLDLRQPVGTVVDQVVEIDDLMALTLSGGGVPPRIILIDPATGRIMGEIAVNASGARPTVP